MKIFTIVGARPQFIKAAAVSRAIAAHNIISGDIKACVQEVLVHTGQHFDDNMSNIFFSELGINKPAYHLGIHGCGHGEMTGRMLIGIEKVLLEQKPDIVLVYGDTNSTLAGALAAVKLHVPIAHVEAGLRSFNMIMPEEINRILTDRLSTMLFCPTDTAVMNLLREGLCQSSYLHASDVMQRIPCMEPFVCNVGDVMYDVSLYYGAQVKETSGILGTLSKSNGLKPGSYCLATIHRAENTDNPERLRNIFAALCEFSKDVPVVIPLHPRTRKILESLDPGIAGIDTGTLIIIEPVGYLDMVQLEKFAALIATDSGGVQKEAFFYGVPCVTLRDETEWVELVDSGWNCLAPPADKDQILSSLQSSIGSRGLDVKPFGTGDASDQIVTHLLSHFI